MLRRLGRGRRQCGAHDGKIVAGLAQQLTAGNDGFGGGRGWCPITELHGTAALRDEGSGKSREK